MKYEHRVENPDITGADLFLKKLIGNKEPVFICIGTDRSTGDALGPLVGDKLQKLGFKVYGTIDNPIHAGNLKGFIEYLSINNDTIIVAIDAALTDREKRIGIIRIEDIPLKPGMGVGKELPEIGEINIKGIVNLGGFMEYLVLQNTRLSLVMKLAERIVQIILFALDISEEYILKKVAI